VYKDIVPWERQALSIERHELTIH